MQYLNNPSAPHNAWNIPQRSPRSISSSKTLHIHVYDSLVSPQAFLRQLETSAGRIHRAAVQIRSDGNGISHRESSVAVISLKVEFLTVDAAAIALGTIQTKQPHQGLAEMARQVVGQLVPSFALDEEDTLLDIVSLHATSTGAQSATTVLSTLGSNGLGVGEFEKRSLAGIDTSSYSGADTVSINDSMGISLMTRPRSCGSEGGSYASSSAPSAGSSTGSSTSARSGSFIRRDDALISHPQGPPDLDYRTLSTTQQPMALHMADILDDYDDLASEISKFELNTPTNDRGNAPWKDTTAGGGWASVSAPFASRDTVLQPYQRPREPFGFPQRLGGERSPPIHAYDWSDVTRENFTPRISPQTSPHGMNGKPQRNHHQQRSSVSSLAEPVSQGNNMSAARPDNTPYYHHRNFSATERPQHTRDSSYSSATTSQSRHSDRQSHDSKSSSSSSRSSVSTNPPGTPTNNNNNNKRAHKKVNQDKRLYSADPHKGPRPTDWMLSDDTLKSRAARDARFAAIVAAGLAPGRTKAGWTQARRPGKRDRDAAKAKLREMEEEKERERLRQLLGEEARPSAPATGVAC